MLPNSTTENGHEVDDCANGVKDLHAEESPCSQFLGYKRNESTGEECCVKEGDTVILHIRHDDLRAIVVRKGGLEQLACERDTRASGGMDTRHRKRGVALRHEALIGVPYGSSLSFGGRSMVRLLHPTPEIWAARCVPHRTQIVYEADAALVCSRLRLMPGACVVEAGTGSAALTHVMARCVAPSGMIHTFEFHQGRAERAREEIAQHGLAGVVRCEWRDVCKQGFPHALADSVDAVFLDLPEPWLALPHARSVLGKTRASRVCCFSPCIEQVLKTAAAMRALGFADIRMFELLMRDIEVRRHTPRSLTLARSSRKRTFKSSAANAEEADAPASVLWSRPALDARGHTSYLTFATLEPKL